MVARGTRLAVDGGTPVRETLLPYSRQWIDEEDIDAVVSALRSDWLTTGPAVHEFETAFAGATGSREAVAVSSGTAALHAAVQALGLREGDEVILPPMTFAATANAVVYQGATPVFTDIDSDTLLLDPERVAEKINPRTRAIIAVDYAGQPCDYDALAGVAESNHLPGHRRRVPLAGRELQGQAGRVPRAPQYLQPPRGQGHHHGRGRGRHHRRSRSRRGHEEVPQPRHLHGSGGEGAAADLVLRDVDAGL